MKPIPNNGCCEDCGDVLVDEFLDVPYVGCGGCPRIYARKED